LPVEGLIHVSSLADDYYYLEAGTHTLVGRRSGRRHRLGDRVLIRIAHIDVDRRELDLVLADAPVSRSRRQEPSRRDAPPAIAAQAALSPLAKPRRAVAPTADKAGTSSDGRGASGFKKTRRKRPGKKKR
jgi:ribonuclease R